MLGPARSHENSVESRMWRPLPLAARTGTRPEPAGLLPRAVLFFALAGYLAVVARTAWMCDDAFITHRVVENVAAGHGLRWNVSDRVPVAWHPLLLSGLRPLTGCRSATAPPHLT